MNGCTFWASSASPTWRGFPSRSLAYGQQRLLDLAIGLALEPKVLLLDEPAAGVPHH